MAANAVERQSALHTNWLRLLAPHPESLEFATRIALICALTTLVTEIYQTPDAALTVYLAFFFNRPERTESLILSVALPLVIGVVIALIFLVANLVVDDAMWRVISIAVISFGLLFLGSASKLRPIAATVALIVGYALALLGTIQTGELATRALLYIYLDVAIVAGVSLLVNLLLAPAPRHTAEQAIADRLKLCAAVLRDAWSPARGELSAKVREGMAPILKLLRFATIEKSAPARELEALQQGALSSFALMSAADALAASPEVEMPGAVRMRLADSVQQLAHIVERGGYPSEVTLELPREANLSPLTHDLTTAIRDAVTHFVGPDAPAQKPAAREDPAAKEGGGFFVEDAFTNPQHVQYGLKTTAAAVFCYLLYSLLDWPGIHTCFLTVYIVAQSTAAESVEKLTLRIIGCLIGAAAGIAAIVFLVPALTSIGGLMIAVFIASWAGGYVAAGGPRISYAGFQFAFAFFLCVIQGSGPSFDLTVARDRIIGILVGILVAYCALVYVWPVTISRRVDPALATALRQLAKAASAKEPRERQLLGSQAQGTLGEIETDIELAHYEPASVRSSAAWLSSRRQLVENSQSLGTLLLISAGTSELWRVDAAMRLERLATRLAGASDTAPLPSRAMESTNGWQTLPARVDRRLRALEKTLASGVGDSEANAHAHA
jgi:multidrug resistance protein MdtO